MIIGYNFYIKPQGSSGLGVKANATPHPTPTYTLDDLVPGAAYEVTATAVDAGGNESVRSTALVASTVQIELPEPGGEMLLADRNAIDSIVNTAKAAGGQKGIVIATTGPRGYYTKAYGTTSGSTPVTPADHFRIGSITKVFVTNKILQMVDAGAMTLDDTVDQYVSGVPNGNIMTIRHLLLMRSGLYTTANDYITALLFLLMPSMNRTRADNMAAIRNPGGFLPGARYDYNNLNYILLGVILETIEGRPIGEIITDDVITPLGLIETTWPTGNTIPAPSGSDGANGTNIDPDFYDASGIIISTVGDLAKFGEHLRNGALLSTDSHALWETEFCGYDWTKTGPDQFGYGMGLMSFGRWFGYNGATLGFGSAVFYDPESGTVIAILQNLGPSLSNLGAGGTEPLHPLFYEIGKYLQPGSMTSPGYRSCEPGILNMPALTAVPAFGAATFIGGVLSVPSMLAAPVLDVPGLSNKLVLPSMTTTPVFDVPPIAMTLPSITTEPVFAVAGTHPYLSSPDLTVDPVMEPPLAWLTRIVEENVDRTAEPLPAGAVAVEVGPFVGAGGGGGCGYRILNAYGTGASGGGGGAKLDPVIVAAELLGSTYSTTRGIGGVGGDALSESGTDGGDSVFTSGGVTITVGGGKGGGPGSSGTSGDAGAGGTGSAVGGVTASFRSGTAGARGAINAYPLAAIDNTVGGGPGGGGGGWLDFGGFGGAGSKGGNSLTATGGAGGAGVSGGGGNNTDGAAGQSGTPGSGGGGGGGGTVLRGGGAGGLGAGGGGGGARNAATGPGGPGGAGGDGYTLLVWHIAIVVLPLPSIVNAPVFAVPLIVSMLPVPSITTTPVMEVAGVYTTFTVPSITTTPVMEVAGVYTTLVAPSITTTPVMEVAALVTITTVVGANANNGDSCTIPAHIAGDLIVLFAADTNDIGSGFHPTKPAAGGTVPDWEYVDAPSTTKVTVAKFKATSSSTTTGNWTGNTGNVAVIVLRGQNPSSPIGGHAITAADSANTAVAPSITLINSSGSSVIVHYHSRESFTPGFTAWDSPPAGYTRRAAVVASSAGSCVNTKDNTTTDGSVTQGINGSGTVTYRCATVEILAV